RLWPLWSHVARENEFRRGYFLWPLGHYRKELTPEPGDKELDEMFLFLPFYGRVRDEKMDYDLVFPFCGRLDMEGRRVRGYALALYNENDNLRKGIREHRLLWFLIRWTSDIPREVGEEVAGEEPPDPMRGGGVFPIYLKRENESKLRETIAWPIYSRRVDEYEDYVLRRNYLLPFYGRRVTDFADGRESESGFLFPFYRWDETEEEKVYKSAPSLFPYSHSEPLDRNWAPVWS